MESLHESLSKLIIYLLDNYSVNDDTLLSKLISAFKEFYSNSDNYFDMSSTLDVFKRHNILELQPNSGSFLLELLGNMAMEKSSRKKVMQIYSCLFEDEFLEECAWALCGCLKGLLHIVKHSFDRYLSLDGMFVDRVLQCLGDKRYFVQRNAFNLVLEIVAHLKQKSGEESYLIANKIVKSLEQLLNTPPSNQFQKIMPFLIIKELYSHPSSTSLPLSSLQLSSSLLLELIKKHLFEEDSGEVVIRAWKCVENMMYCEHDELKKLKLQTMQQLLLQQKLLPIIAISFCFLKSEQECDEVYLKMFLSPLTNKHLDQNASSPACTQLCLFLASQLIIQVPQTSNVITSTIVSYMNACVCSKERMADDDICNMTEYCMSSIILCLQVVQKNCTDNNFCSVKCMDCIINIISLSINQQLLVNSAIKSLAAIINSSNCYPMSQLERLGKLLNFLHESTSWQMSEFILDFVASLHVTPQQCQWLKKTGINDLVLDCLYHNHVSVQSSALLALVSMLKCDCLVFPATNECTLNTNFQKKELSHILEILKKHDEAIARRAAIVFVHSYLSYYFHLSDITKEPLNKFEEWLERDGVMQCMQQVVLSNGEDDDWEVKVKSVECMRVCLPVLVHCIIFQQIFQSAENFTPSNSQSIYKCFLTNNIRPLLNHFKKSEFTKNTVPTNNTSPTNNTVTTNNTPPTNNTVPTNNTPPTNNAVPTNNTPPTNNAVPTNNTPPTNNKPPTNNTPPTNNAVPTNNTVNTNNKPPTNNTPLTSILLPSILTAILNSLCDYEDLVKKSASSFIFELRSLLDENFSKTNGGLKYCSADSTHVFVSMLTNSLKLYSYDVEEACKQLQYHTISSHSYSTHKNLKDAMENVLVSLTKPCQVEECTSDEEEYLDFKIVDCY